MNEIIKFLTAENVEFTHEKSPHILFAEVIEIKISGSLLSIYLKKHSNTFRVFGFYDGPNSRVSRKNREDQAAVVVQIKRFIARANAIQGATL